MGANLLAVVIGLVSGVLSGMFGIGGGLVTTPAIRLIMRAPALIAVGTPLVALIPSAITGATTFLRKGTGDLRAGIASGLAGTITAVFGALLTRVVSGSAVLVITAVVIGYTAVDMVLHTLRSERRRAPSLDSEDALLVAVEETPSQDDLEVGDSESASASGLARPALVRLIACGAAAGLYSGFLGLGGGFVLVPLLSRWVGFSVKRAIATSLIAISILALPGAITHILLGNVDLPMAALLVVGVVPGAMLGARLALGSSDRFLRLGFATVLAVTGIWLGANEIVGWLAQRG